MDDYITGQIVISKAGHDKGQFYIILNSDLKYVYLIDGKQRLIDSPKRKNKKHIQKVSKILEEPFTNEKVYKFIKECNHIQ